MTSKSVQIGHRVAKTFSANIANARAMSSQMVDIADVVFETQSAVLAFFRVTNVIGSVNDASMINESLSIVEHVVAASPHKSAFVDVDFEWRHTTRFHGGRKIRSIMRQFHVPNQIGRSHHLQTADFASRTASEFFRTASHLRTTVVLATCGWSWTTCQRR